MGTTWRCRSRVNISTIDEVFSDCALPTPPGATVRPKKNSWKTLKSNQKIAMTEEVVQEGVMDGKFVKNYVRNAKFDRRL